MLYNNRCRVACLACLAALQSSLAARPLPPLPQPTEHTVPVAPVVFESPDQARVVWQAREGTDPVANVTGATNAILAFPVSFQGNTLARATWDRPTTLDLSASQGLEFLFFCRDPAPVKGFTFYLKSGDGWYAAEFEHPDPEAWTRVRIRKSDTHLEGQPQGWSRIESLRISAWRADNADTVFYLAHLAAIREPTSIALIRNESAAPDERQGVFSYTKNVADHLIALDIRHVTLSDLDLSPTLLHAKKLLVLPYMPAPPDLEVVADFIRGGGKLLSFYTLPNLLQPLLGIELGRRLQQNYPGHFAAIRAAGSHVQGLPPVVRQRSWNIVQARPLDEHATVAAFWHSDDGSDTEEPALLLSPSGMHATHVLISDNPEDKRALLLAMIGHFLPHIWLNAARDSLSRASTLDPWSSAQATRQGLASAAQPGSEVYRNLSQAMEYLDAARAALGEKRYPASMEASGQARRSFIRALAGVQTPQTPEHRGVWRHSAFPLDGSDWNETLRLLADNGFNAFFPNMLWAGLAYCQSDVLPVSPLVARRGDPLAGALQAAKEHGVALHVWKVNWNTGGRAPESFMQRMAQEGRLQVSYSGQTHRHWLCPSHPDNRALELASLTDLVRRYAIDGIHLDYMRYPSRDHCFCEGCRRRFELKIGKPVAQWPADIRAKPDLAEAWSEYRRDTLNTMVEAIANRVRDLRTDIVVSAAVFSHWPTDRHTIGQDWAVWAKKGWVDIICPMNYTANTSRFEQVLERQRTWAAPAPVYPGIGLAVWPEAGDPVRLFDQIRATRRQQAQGFMIFQYREHEASTILPLCGMGITRPQAAR